ncbi:MaoC family dehydratase [Nocardioides halotolerans]|uniref:MaoC family dehydratase n=1 Tax=Nocardioides halotolerans TaxID=433660 RepID=UPI00048E4791|nr:MaoC family dehydratase [Nocardioides halotolerans]
MQTFNSLDEMRAFVGNELGAGEWHQVTQERINAFADATDDHEQIHVNPQRAIEAGLGGTIAHGMYTLSLGPKFIYQLYSVAGFSLSLNYGYEKVRFLSPVKVDSFVRMRATLSGARPIEGGTVFAFDQTFEVKDQEKPACVAQAVVAYFD